MSHLSFQFLQSIFPCQFIHVNSCVSIPSCQVLHFNWLMSIHFSCNSFHLNSLFPTHHEFLYAMSLFRNFRPGACRALPGIIIYVSHQPILLPQRTCLLVSHVKSWLQGSHQYHNIPVKRANTTPWPSTPSNSACGWTVFVRSPCPSFLLVLPSLPTVRVWTPIVVGSTKARWTNRDTFLPTQEF